MKNTIHRSHERGKGEHGWLSTRYSFSFNTWYEPSRMGFGALRVINDDRIAPGAGFPPHTHRDMEIITIVMSGAVAHKDSTGGEGITRAGEVQVMSAGNGVAHSEFNASTTEELTLFQLWITTDTSGVEPRYASMQFLASEESTLLVSPIDSPEAASGLSLGIHQDAYITRSRSRQGTTKQYALRDPNNGVYVFVISGTITIIDTKLESRDAAGIEDIDVISYTVKEDSDVLFIEVPMVGE